MAFRSLGVVDRVERVGHHQRLRDRLERVGHNHQSNIVAAGYGH
jgi:hypothetical protein